jgi:hypothetical protein
MPAQAKKNLSSCRLLSPFVGVVAILISHLRKTNAPVLSPVDGRFNLYLGNLERRARLVSRVRELLYAPELTG